MVRIFSVASATRYWTLPKLIHGFYIRINDLQIGFSCTITVVRHPPPSQKKNMKLSVNLEIRMGKTQLNKYSKLIHSADVRRTFTEKRAYKIE